MLSLLLLLHKVWLPAAGLMFREQPFEIAPGFRKAAANIRPRA